MSSEEEPVAWLRAQVEARKATAELAAREGGTWTQEDPERHPGSIESLGGKVVYDEGSPDEYQAAHLALNDPRDVIARCEAELAILDEHPACTDDADHCGRCQNWLYAVPAPWPCTTIRALAWGYRLRPGFPAAFADLDLHAG